MIGITNHFVRKELRPMLSSSLQENIDQLHIFLPIGKSFDLFTRELYIGKRKAFLLGINGFCDTDALQRIIEELQKNPCSDHKELHDDSMTNHFMTYDSIFNNNAQKEENISSFEHFLNTRIGYSQVEFLDSVRKIVDKVLSGLSLLLIDGFEKGVLLDVRSYPARSMEEPDMERSTRGARDGFVETLVTNCNLIRRRIRSPHMTFQLMQAGTESRTDIAVAYQDDLVDPELLHRLIYTIQNLKITSLTMGSRSLEELLIQKHWWNPLPVIQQTERPDVACSYLSEGHILLIVDNSPSVLILPCTIFQFTQSPEDYYKNPLVGTYFRLLRFLCIPMSLLLLPLFLLLNVYFPQTADLLHLSSTNEASPGQMIFFVIAVELGLDLFKYSTSVTSSRFSNALSIVGGLLVGDIAIKLNWASAEVLFYAAISLLASLSLANIDFADALRLYRIFLILTTAVGGLVGFLVGFVLVILSVITTPTFSGMSYFWPLYPFNKEALYSLVFRKPTAKAQPCKIWERD